jgi:hypothetical protein
MEEVTNTYIYKYGKDIIWSLPCLFQYEPLFGFFQLSLMNAKLDMIKANVYGSPATIWSSGRMPLINVRLGKENLAKLFNYIQNWNGTPTFTFSRTDITKDDLKDEYANYLLDFGIEHNARFIVSSDILRDYIRKKSSQTQIVASVLKSIYRFQGAEKIEEPTVEAETEYYNKLLKEYDIVVVRPEYSKTVLTKNPELLDDISRIEVLINQTCVSNCPLAPLHSTIISAMHREEHIEEEENFRCLRTKYDFPTLYKNNSAHTYEDVAKLVKSGVKYLKLQGRGEPIPYYENAVQLLVNMFNLEGPNAFLLNVNNLVLEINRFYREVDTERLWYYEGAFDGVRRNK